MEILVLAAVLGVIPGMIASRKGHSFGMWWLYGALLFIVALPHALLLDPPGDNPEILQQVLYQIERDPGQVMGALAIRSGLDLKQLMDALVELHDQGMITFRLTGREVPIGKEMVPEVRAYPRDETTEG